MSPHVMQDGGSSQYCIIIVILQRILLGERAVYAMMLVFPPEFSPLKTVQFGNPSQDTVDPRDGGFGGRLWRWKWEK